MTSTSIDVDLTGRDPVAVAAELLLEMGIERTHRDDLVALRKGQRLVQELGRPRSTVVPSAMVMREEGVYVIAGGTGYLGIQIAKWMARQQKATIVLLSRNALPPREGWAELKRKLDSDSALAYQLSGIAEVEASGSKVFSVSADVTHAEQMDLALQNIRQQHGPIRGVVVAMKELYHKPIYQLSETEFTQGIMNRVRGTWLLDTLTRNDPLDFFVPLSSISSIMGTKTASECCAVNQFLDAYAAYGRKASRPVSVMNLTLILEDLRDFRGPSPIPPLNFEQFAGCFDRFMKLRPPLSVVSQFDAAQVKYLLPVIKIRFAPAVLAEMGIGLEKEVARAVQIAATPISQDQVENTVASIWQEVLGHQDFDADTNFFEAGGTSLTALKLVQLARTQFPIRFEAADVFGNSTMSLMTTFIAQQVGAQQAAPVEVSTLPESSMDLVLQQLADGALSVDAAFEALGGTSSGEGKD